jgi:hypothetical protein
MYKIIGTDGRQYGPIATEQLRQWIAENRVESRTPVFVEGATDWSFVGLLPEFAGSFPGQTLPPPLSSAPPKLGSIAPSPLRRTHPYATTGLIFGLLSVTCCCGCPFNILGIVFSLIAMTQINRQPEIYDGRGLAIAGLVLSILGLASGLVMALFQLALAPQHMMWQLNNF